MAITTGLFLFSKALFFLLVFFQSFLHCEIEKPRLRNRPADLCVSCASIIVIFFFFLYAPVCCLFLFLVVSGVSEPELFTSDTSKDNHSPGPVITEVSP